MRTPATLLVLILPLAAAGCSKPAFYWYHPDRTYDRALRDYCRCERYARDEAAQAYADERVDRRHSAVRSPEDFAVARRENGFQDAPPDMWPTWGEPYRYNLLSGCMKRRGYEKVRAYSLPSQIRTRSLSLGAIAGRKGP